LKRAFAVPPKQKEKIRGKRLLLIDDVCTTGATLRAAAQALLKAGAHEVSALTLAYVDKRKLFNEPLNLK
jgi:predicted amidophosphoribosyltransferase